MYTLHIRCPHCSFHEAIHEWPRAATEAVLFTCLPKHGGCGGQSIVQPPDVGVLSALEEVFVPGHPLTPEEASRLKVSHDLTRYMNRRAQGGV